MAGPVPLARRRHLDRLVAELGSVDVAAAVVQAFASTMHARVDVVVDGMHGGRTSRLDTVRDLRCAASALGAIALADACRRVLAAPEAAVDALELVVVAAQTEAWAEQWLADALDPS